MAGEGAPRPLSDGEVHVWCTTLDLPAHEVEALYALLSPDERLRARGYYFRRDRDRFVVGRGLLRRLLGAYLGAAPERVRLAYAPAGKPWVPEGGRPPLTFNLAHSEGLAVCALARGRRVGVDVERVRPALAGLDVARHFFAREEVCALEALPAAERVAAFFRCWTRKEAYVKALGDGLSAPLDQFAVSLAPDAGVGLRWVAGRADEPSRWTPLAWSPAPGYLGALFVEGAGVSVMHMHGWGPGCHRGPPLAPQTSDDGRVAVGVR